MFARESLEDIVNKYNKDYNLLEIIVKDLENYRIVVVNALKNKQNIEDFAHKVFVGKYDHISNIEIRLDFIEFITKNAQRKNELTLEQLKKLWTILVIKCNSDVEKNYFLEWLIKPKEKNQKKTYILADNSMKDLLN